MKITCVVIDDEIASIKNLEKKITNLFPELTLLKTFQKPEEAIDFLNLNDVNIIFLDIQMPRINGFEVLTALNKINFQIIFVTAFNEYAIEAFKKSALDYVLKPIDDVDLKHAVNKAIEVINKENEIEQSLKLIKLLQENISGNNKLLIPTAKGFSVIDQNQIIYLEGYDGYSKINIESDKQIISSYSIGKYEDKLNSNFFKTHKSYIVNLDKIIEFEKEGYVVLGKNIRIPISKKSKNELLGLLK